MKTLMLGTTALVAATLVATGANAADWDVRVGGYYNAMVAYADAGGDNGSNDSNEINFGSDTDVFFLPSITLDNGLTIGARVVLDAEENNDVDSNSDLIDEVYIYGQGGFGRIEFGQTNGAGYKLGRDIIPDVLGHSVDGNEDNEMDPFAPYDVYTGLRWTSLRNRITTSLQYTEDRTKVSYYSPAFSGFTFGASYTPNPCKNDTGFSDCLDTEFGRNTVELAGSFNRQVNNVWLRLFGGYTFGQSDDTGKEPEEWSVGAQLRFGGVTFGGVYTEHDTRSESAFGSPRFDVKVQTAGSVQYRTGPWTFDLQAGRSESGNVQDDFIYGNVRSRGEYDSYMAGVTYQVGPGVEVGGGLRAIDFSRDTRGGMSDNSFDTNATSIFVGSRISF